jgi:hypothetical protein
MVFGLFSTPPQQAGRSHQTESRVSVSKHEATRAEYDRFGSVGIPMAGQSNQNPATCFLPEHSVQDLLQRANDLSSGASPGATKPASCARRGR